MDRRLHSQRGGAIIAIRRRGTADRLKILKGSSAKWKNRSSVTGIFGFNPWRVRQFRVNLMLGEPYATSDMPLIAAQSYKMFCGEFQPAS
jgi:hypothetical protein